MSGDKPLKILVIGCGSIGRRHIRLLKEMGVEVWGCDTDTESCYRVNRELQVDCYRDLEAALIEGHFTGAIVATPNHLHREAAEECLRAGCGVLIEKPMCHTSEEAGALELLHNVRPHPLLVGYSLRFHPGLQRVKELISQGAIGTVRHASLHFGSYLPAWRPGVDYRTNYAASREQGGGILMDASHELDYACRLFGRPVSVMAQVQNTGALEIETEDVADLVIRFESGMQANIHLDYLSREYHRGCLITGDKDTLQFEMGADGWYWLQVGPKQNQQYWAVDRDEMYRAELRHFLACLRGEEQPLVTGDDGVRAVRLVEAARRSSEEGRVILL